MKFVRKIEDVQHQLIQQELDGWLFYDFRRSNDLACQFLEIPKERLLTRRFFYWIPKKGEPEQIVHAIEPHSLAHLPGQKFHYHTYQELEAQLARLLKGSKRIAMEYSPRNAIPYVSKVDGGTLDCVRGCGVEVVSSADLLQRYTSVWDAHKLSTHLAAAEVLDRTVELAWQWIAEALSKKRPITEYDVQQFILRQFETHGCVTSDPPICAVNAHAADPHYGPEKNRSSPIVSGDFILIDLWCKQNKERAVYADISRVGVAAKAPTPKQNEVFNIVLAAQTAGIELVKKRFADKQPVTGAEVDQCCRKVIVDAGYGSYFIHRTGHNIDERDHGDGANLDSLETWDYRHLLPGTCFSVEPGIYLPGEFGVRLECDVYIHLDGTVQVTGGSQEKLRLLIE